MWSPPAPEDVDFRAEIRAWLRENIPQKPAPAFYTPDRRAYDAAWQRSLLEGGFGALGWPTELGGREVTVSQQMIFHEELANAGAPDVGCLFIALNHAGPTVATRGTQAQRERHIPRILRGEELWCQGFSEPEAGSDLASIRTRGDVHGDVVVVNGSKIWTSYAHLADFCELLINTDRSAGRHKGLTWMILDMRTPGVTVRPIKTLTGNPRFSEVTFDDVEVPLDNVVGGLNNGWSVAMSTLGFERGSAMMGRQVRTLRRIEELRDYAEKNGALADPLVRAELDALRRDAFAVRALVHRSLKPHTHAQGASSVLRVFHSELVGRLTRLAMRIQGEEVVTLGSWNLEYLNELRSKVTAGTLDIHRDIIGNRLLGLPR
ncbi:acyl-CoA dehydrogenase [Acrocarpospora pleiomorpha]|uniref:Acyl-CoA dehydrogenase n=1 Tax=Acrocarpospora pleiomorpha TaxID=90975 RepID=A0A5M3XX97_9ACTN|nr:acyl-CoA dehydrogenase [Acrocarpospora pleiomorpha]